MALTLGQAAKIANVSKPTMSKWLKDGKLSGTKNDEGVYEIDKSELDRFLAFHRSKQTLLSDVSGNGKLGVSSRKANASEASPEAPTTSTGIEALDALTNANEVKYVAAIEILKAERAALQKALAKSEQQYEHLEARMDDMQATYEETLRNVTRLIEDKRPASEKTPEVITTPVEEKPEEPKKRTKFLGIF